MKSSASSSQSTAHGTNAMDARIVELNGAAVLQVNGERQPFVAFKPTEHADEVLFESTVDRTVRDMADRGVHVHLVPIYFGWEGPGVYRFGGMDQRIERVLHADPQAKIVIRIQAASMCPKWWMQANPGHVLRFGFAQDSHGPRPAHQTRDVVSLASDFWHTLATDALRALAEHVQQQRYASRVIGYLPAALNSNEWFIRSYDALEVADFSPAMQEAFAGHLHEQYDIRATVPDRLQRGRGDVGMFYHPDPRRSHAPVTEFYKFLNARCATAILAQVRALREAHPADRLLIGVFYGYHMGLANFYWLAESGHLDMRQLIDAADGPDFISSPLEYFTRNTREKPFGGFCWAQGPAVDSARLVGKTYFAEDDFCPPLPGQPDGWSNAGDDEEDVQLMRRNFVFTLCKGSLLWWYDLNGHWFESAGRLETVERCTSIARRSMSRDRRGVSHIAVFMDEAASQRMTLDAQMQRAMCWSSFFESFADIGAPVDLFMLSDLESVDCRGYRMICFPTAFCFTPAQRQKLEQLKADGRTLVFGSVAGLVDEQRGVLDEKGLSEVAGMRISMKRSLHPLRLSMGDDHPLLAGHHDESFGIFTEALPVFHVEDESAQALGYFVSRGPVGLAMRDHGDWRSVYCAVPGLASWLVQRLAQEAGVHLYRDGDSDIVYANECYVGVFSREAGQRTVRLPRPRCVYECFTQQQISAEPVETFNIEFAARKTYLFELS